jgi:hypothetical protein
METDNDLAGALIYDRDSAGMITQLNSAGTLFSTASKFAVGCKLTDTTTGKTYRNVGTIAVPSWNDVDLSDANAEVGVLYQQVKQVSLTAANLLAMYTTPVEVVPAVAGKSIIVDSVEFDITRTATQFTGGGVVNVQYANTANGAGTKMHADIAAAVVTAGAGRTITSRIPTVLSDIASASIVGIGLYISNATAIFETGTGTAVVTVRYHLV